MSKTEIIAELPRLQSAELAEVQATLDALAGDVWLDGGELSGAGSSWGEVRSRIEGKLRA